MSTKQSGRPIGMRGPIVLCLSVALFLTLGASGARANTMGLGWCSQVPAPCIVSATVNSHPVTDDDPTWYIYLGTYSFNGSSNINVNVGQDADGTFDLGTSATSDVWSIVVNVGSVVPRVTYVTGNYVTITRPTGSNTDMTITGDPVTVDNNDNCNFSGSLPTCPETNDEPSQTLFNAEIGDYNLNEYTSAQIASFYGMNMYSNIDETGLPPEIQQNSSGDNELVVQLANQHYYGDNTTVFTGYFHLFIPYNFMQQVWGITDPSTIATDGLSGSVGGGTVTVTDETGGLEIDASGITFTRRTLVIRASSRLVPARPTDLHAKRIGNTARITFHKSKARGSRITGYEVSCTAKHWARRTAHSTKSPLTVHGLGATGYVCAVRARSKAGNSTAAETKIAR
jgi:hypothetical protein